MDKERIIEKLSEMPVAMLLTQLNIRISSAIKIKRKENVVVPLHELINLLDKVLRDE